MRNLEKLNMLGKLVFSLILTCIFPSSATIVHAKPPPPPSEPKHSPNILFIILDDVGIDQLRSFNPFSPQAVPVPNIDAIVNNGVKFTNLWTMPECSPSRACFFTGRYPLRTGVTAALLPEDLPRAQVSPYEATIPRVLAHAGSRVLAHAGYESALIGKYHLGGPENNPDGMAAPAKLGWDFFNGNLAASPPAIDTTVGGQYLNDDVEVRYPCGFPTGPQTGACWFQDSNGTPYCDDNSGAGYTGNQCVTMGGIPALDLNGNFAPSCAEANPSPPDFTKQNAYYVWQRVTIDGKKIDTSPARKYATTAQTDDAID